jgi:acetate kinase
MPPILCLNGGSSSLKFAVFDLDGAAEVLRARGAVERIGLDAGRFWVQTADGASPRQRHADYADHAAAVAATFDALSALDLARPAAVGHRIVHGGARHSAPERVTTALLEALRALVPFAPLHLPSEIHVIEAVASRFADLPQVVCFDTAFHRRMPEVAQRFALPRALWDDGVRRYGFHGLSYEYIVQRLRPPADARTIIAHLGNGASMAAVRGSAPIDTTMGLTPTGGVMMGTRSGDLDPGVLVYLMNHKSYDAQQVDRLVNFESGLLGVSGRSPDMKTLLELREREADAALAVEMFCYQLRKQIGAFAAALGGLDTLVFTGGIGERAAPVRAAVCQGLGHLGIAIDPRGNAVHGDIISTPNSRCTVHVIPTDEDLMIARHTHALVRPDASVGAEIG